MKIDGKWGYINKDGEVMVGPRFDEAGGFHDGLARVCNGEVLGMGGTCGWINKSGKPVWTPED